MENYDQPKARPTILTVFGILTFVGAGLTILSGLFSMVNTSGLEMLGMPIYIPILQVLLSGVKIFGVIEMFKLRKNGFYFYTISEIAMVILGIMSFKYSARAFAIMPGGMSEMGDMILVGQIIFTIVMSGLWIGIYAAQLKHMD